jgi:hypothetical protein
MSLFLPFNPIGYRVADPLSTFYPSRFGGFDRQSVRSNCLLISTDELERLKREREEQKAREKKEREDAGNTNQFFTHRYSSTC